MKKKLRYFICISIYFIAMGCDVLWAKSAPVWSKELPLAVRAGGAGKVCWATEISGGFQIMPVHCLGETRFSLPESSLPKVAEKIALGRDYVISHTSDFNMKIFKNRGVHMDMIAQRDKAAGTHGWVERGGSWDKVVIVSSMGSSYMVEFERGSFCPGDSGASLWVAEEGVPKWAGMLISGTTVGCSSKSVILKSSAIDWPSSR